MNYILYNDKSNRGKAVRAAFRLAKKIKNAETISLLNISGEEQAFCQKLNEDDKLILIGGDGTVHHFLNSIYPMNIKFHLYVMACGSGNDLSRDYKRHKMFEITHLVNDLPIVKINNDKDYVFINGVGMGVDSLVCHTQLENANNNLKQSYFKVALKVFKSFKPYNLKIIIDEKEYTFKNVWFFVCNNGRYFGGGMKITPKALREDEYLDVCVVHSIKLWRLIILFPLVFLGLHSHFAKKKIFQIKCKHVLAYPTAVDIMQRDGDVTYNVRKLEINR